MSEQSLLQECQRYFPGLTWHLDDGYEQAFAHCFLGGLRFDFSLTWNGESYGIFASAERHQVFVYYGGTPALTLAAAAAHWRELVAEAGAVVGQVAEQKLKLYTVTASDVHDQWTSKPYTSMAEAEAVLSDIEGSYMSSGIEEHEVVLPGANP
jgi:hypothetical protein